VHLPHSTILRYIAGKVQQQLKGVGTLQNRLSKSHQRIIKRDQFV